MPWANQESAIFIHRIFNEKPLYAATLHFPVQSKANNSRTHCQNTDGKADCKNCLLKGLSINDVTFGGRVGVNQLNDAISEQAKISACKKFFLGPLFRAKLAIFGQLLPKNGPNLVFVVHK